MSCFEMACTNTSEWEVCVCGDERKKGGRFTFAVRSAMKLNVNNNLVTEIVSNEQSAHSQMAVHANKITSIHLLR